MMKTIIYILDKDEACAETIWSMWFYGNFESVRTYFLKQ